MLGKVSDRVLQIRQVPIFLAFEELASIVIKGRVSNVFIKHFLSYWPK